MQTLTNHLDPIGRGDAMDQGSGLVKCEQCLKKHEPDSFGEFEGCQLCPKCLVEWIAGTIEEDGKAEYKNLTIEACQVGPYKFSAISKRIDEPSGYFKTIQEAIDFINEI